MSGLRVLVCGGRNFADTRLLCSVLDRIEAEHGISCIISGCATGADSDAIGWAYDDQRHPTIKVERFPARWKEQGRLAGPIRNSVMLKQGKPDLIVAFDGGRGTADMVRKAKAAGVRVIEVAA